MSRFSCKDCLDTCCNDMKIVLSKGKKGKNPSKLKAGDWFYVMGITLVKKKNGLWKCRAFDTKTKLCRIWRYRPPICRHFFCDWSREVKRKLPVNAINDKYYLLKKEGEKND